MHRRRTACAALGVVAMAGAQATEPPHAVFSTGALRHGKAVDATRFAHGMPAPVGWHDVEVFRNDASIGRERVRFIAGETVHSSMACIAPGLLARLGVAPDAIRPVDRDCATIDALVPHASAQYDSASLALRLTIPQAALASRESTIDPSQWDPGITALRLDYGLQAIHRRDTGHDATARLGVGLNVGTWRARHRATLGWRSGRPSRHDAIATTLDTDVPSLGAQFAAGDFPTSGVLFDTVGVRGLRLESDDRMVPAAFEGHAPLVRGVAATQARVQVRQDGHLIADTPVPPGPFALRDLRTLGRGRALAVRVIESDGTTQDFTVPNVAGPGLLRAGRSRFGVVAGQLRDAPDAPPFVQLTTQSGLHDRLTAHAGLQVAPDYAQGLAGVAFAFGPGAWAIDRMQSRFAPAGHARQGGAWKLAYAGELPGTNTTVDVAAWRHGDRAFRTVSTAMRERVDTFVGPRQTSRLDLSLRQRLGRTGGLAHLTATQFRDHAGATRRSAHLGGAWPVGKHKRGTLQATLLHGADTHFSLLLSLPLLASSGALHVMQANARMAKTTHALHWNANGPLDAVGATRYSVGASRDATPHDTTHGGHASLAHAGRAGDFGLGLARGTQGAQWSASASGTLVAHADGVTAGPPAGPTLALVHAPGGHGARLERHPTIRLDRAGRALVPHVTPYRASQVGVDPATAAPDLHFDWTGERVVPRAGAIVPVALPTSRMRSLLIRPMRDGAPMPAGTALHDASGAALASVGRDGYALVRLPHDVADIAAHWHDDETPRRCTLALPVNAMPMLHALDLACEG
jgi:outer membrane usher protein